MHIVTVSSLSSVRVGLAWRVAQDSSAHHPRQLLYKCENPRRELRNFERYVLLKCPGAVFTRIAMVSLRAVMSSNHFDTYWNGFSTLALRGGVPWHHIHTYRNGFSLRLLRAVNSSNRFCTYCNGFLTPALRATCHGTCFGTYCNGFCAFALRTSMPSINFHTY